MVNRNKNHYGSTVGQAQQHYDLGNEFFALFLDPSMTYSCAKFDGPQISLAAAQRAKIDLALGKCELKAGQLLLDVGCGWGGTALRAAELHQLRVIGLTVSKNQYAYAQGLATNKPRIEFRMQSWETFNEPVDRIVSIGAFEHFGRDKHRAFFEKCRTLLPEDGIVVVQSITFGKPSKVFSFLRFVRFMSKEIFPGGDVPTPEVVIKCARSAHLELDHVESMRKDYVHTLECWENNLEANRKLAVELTNEATYSMYKKYLTSCAAYFRSGECNVHQFKLRPI